MLSINFPFTQSCMGCWEALRTGSSFGDMARMTSVPLWPEHSCDPWVGEGELPDLLLTRSTRVVWDGMTKVTLPFREERISPGIRFLFSFLTFQKMPLDMS